MNRPENTETYVKPRLTPLPGGGWLAVVRAGHPRVGVVADTEREARQDFARALERRGTLLAEAKQSQTNTDVAVPGGSRD
jgi:hypothetical protein